MMNFVRVNYGESMSHERLWSSSGWHGESLHASEVTNVRELKYCERCGALGVRLQGSPAHFCLSCKPAMMISARRMQ